MQSLWNDADAAAFEGPLAERVYTSRLLGRDHALVLHGGGNTSVKIRERNLFGDEEDILYVKGSGWDLETIEPAGFAPVRLERALRLAALRQLSDAQMVQELRAAMINGAPAASEATLRTRAVSVRSAVACGSGVGRATSQARRSARYASARVTRSIMCSYATRAVSPKEKNPCLSNTMPTVFGPRCFGNSSATTFARSNPGMT